MQPTVNIALRSIREASEELVRAFERFDFDHASERDISKFLAECRIGTEKKIIFSLKRAFPRHSFEGPETGIREASPESSTLWKINPIEGLENFRNRLPLYSINVACITDGKVEHALVLNPATGEEFTASRGRGASYNGRRIRSREVTKLSQCILGVNYPGLAQTERNQKVREQIARLTEHAHGVRTIGANALTVAYAAAGHLHAAWMCDLEETDLLASSLIAKEAGCLLSDFSGGTDYSKSGDIAVANPRLIKALLQTAAGTQAQ